MAKEPANTKTKTADAELSLESRIEAILMTVERPINANKIAELLECEDAKQINEAIDTLNKAYEKTGRSFRIEAVAGGFQILTLPPFKPIIQALHQTRTEAKLSPAAMETLAIIAYKQPILRAEIESIRGVASGEIIRSLMDKHLVRIAGRAEEIGRPMLYGTTKRFLEVFGLSSLKDLPKVEELVKP